MQDGESPKGAQLLYARWKPAHVVGDQYGSVFCRKSCRKSHVAEQKRIKTCSQRIERILIRMIGTRFPDAAIVTEGMNKPRIYLRRDRTGHVRIDEAGVHFDFPGQKYGPASLVIRTITEWTGQKSKRHRGKPSYECLRGDVDVFEAYAASTAREERAA